MDEYKLGFVAFSPLAQGRLLDKFNPANPPQFEPGDHRKGSSAFSAEEITRLKPKLDKLKARFGDTIEGLAAMSLGYILAQPNVVTVIPGFRNERQAKCNVAGGGKNLTADEVAFVKETLNG
jgi:aryl-alcohol dehydrogenase-like predicted oxidoreductase